MMGIFSTDDAKKLLFNKFVVFIGDSVQRGAYKDLVLLLSENRIVTQTELKCKGEKSFLGDTSVEQSAMTNGLQYREVREFRTDNHLVRFYFVTRIYNEYVEGIIKDFKDVNQPTPDVVFVNSCLWDISRYGNNISKVMFDYYKNLEKFCSELDEALPVESSVIWRTTLPVAKSARGGFLANTDAAKKTETLLLDVFLANHTAHAVVTSHKYDVIDMHYFFVGQQRRRANDGIHWNSLAHRRMTNIFLSHISLGWGLGLPEQDLDFNQNEIDMNTTSLLHNAYTEETTPWTRPHNRPMDAESRYGGPIRNSNEMYYNQFKKFYNYISEDVPPQVAPQFFLEPYIPQETYHYINGYETHQYSHQQNFAPNFAPRKWIPDNHHIHLNFNTNLPLQTSAAYSNQPNRNPLINRTRKFQHPGKLPYNKRFHLH